ncbi:hypothetical protein [Moheibacter sediminis]|uniref:GAF domain-containing protein n=1 Tax=Moheibacter sediminis TaxID=1434700 RepID=A0A1W2AXQ0_9FLAO|nr:hypothetical protein [Moheibacter sediminis]SMC65505.1 hypothetical protein SAMN06296427_105127 [Moheibacter sediminis]
MKSFSEYEMPFEPVLSFEAVISELEKKVENGNADERTIHLLEKVNEIPEFKSGFNNFGLVQQYSELISELLSDLFPKLLTDNEIKAATLPLSNLTFNSTERFQKLIAEAGKEFQIADTNFDSDEFYIMSCSIILAFHYHVPFSSTYPMYFNMRDKDGIQRFFRILYNADFLEIYPTENAKNLTETEIEFLMDNIDDIDLWKEKFPPQSWLLKGFGLMNLYDATIETSVSNLKQELLNKSNSDKHSSTERLEDNLKSIFNVKDLSVGISDYNPLTKRIVKTTFNDYVTSQLVHSNHDSIPVENSRFLKHLNENKPFVISNTDKYIVSHPDEEVALKLQKSGVKSAMLIPMKKDDNLLGIMEFVSETPHGFNSITAQRIDLILSFLIESMERAQREISNLTDALIQKEYTSIHPSVAWKFQKEAENFIKSPTQDYAFREVMFQDVYALYGEVDIKNSSVARNNCIKEDIQNQLNMLMDVLDELKKQTKLELLDQRKFEIESHLNNLNFSLEAGTEQEIQQYIANEIHPILANLNLDENQNNSISRYLKSLDPITGLYYHARQNFDDTISIINKKLASVLDEKQVGIQQVFPHYFERFKTDGIEHNIYIGSSITPTRNFDLLYLYNMRLWQLQAICEMENEHHRIKPFLPIQLDVTSLILAFNQPLAIRFRMDEKRFDVDGTYNARYEIVKKRIDKAFVKDTDERITQPGKITIVYSHSNEETEYLKYIKFLQHKGILDAETEFLQVENLQGITGLKALRVKILRQEEMKNQAYFTYEELVAGLK